MPKKSQKIAVLGRGGPPAMLKKGGKAKKPKMPKIVMPKFGAGGDIGSAIGKSLGDWVQNLFGFKKGGRPRK